MPVPDARRNQLLAAASTVASMVATVVLLYSSPQYWSQEYHTSKLTGAAWVDELLDGHPDRTELGVRLHVFLMLEQELRITCGVEDSCRGITVKEQLAIFLYMCVTGLSVRHVGERFQRSNETISRYVSLLHSCFIQLKFFTQDTFATFLESYPLDNFIKNMSGFLIITTPYQLSSNPIQNSFLILVEQLEQWMALISTVVLQLQIRRLLVTAKEVFHKTVLLVYLSL